MAAVTTTDAQAAAIKVEGLAKRFGDVVALAGIDLEVEPATVFGLLGPNGAGKTTTVRVLTTVLKPDAGRAEVLGHDVARHPELVRASIGLAGQFAAVDEQLTARENLKLVGRLTHVPTRIARRRSDELLERFDLVDAANRAVKTYSGGMRRRLDVAAALMNHPPVLLLDEPTTGLDPRSRSEVWATVESLVEEGTTVLLTTQYLEEADRLANRLAVVDHGRVIASGRPEELKASLGATALAVGFADETAATRAAILLQTIGKKDPAVDGKLVEISVDDGPRLLVEALRILDHEGLAPSSINLHEPSLDDVFLAITGRRATTDEAGTDEDEAIEGQEPTSRPTQRRPRSRARSRRREPQGVAS
jgi:daunorubicin resistance ABC transporter ATP-binding subunit